MTKITLRDVGDMEKGRTFVGKPKGTHHFQTFTRVKDQGHNPKGVVVSEFGHWFWLGDLQPDSLEDRLTA